MQIEVIALSLSGNLVRAHLDCRLISFSRRQNFHIAPKNRPTTSGKSCGDDRFEFTKSLFNGFHYALFTNGMWSGRSWMSKRMNLSCIIKLSVKECEYLSQTWWTFFREHYFLWNGMDKKRSRACQSLQFPYHHWTINMCGNPVTYSMNSSNLPDDFFLRSVLTASVNKRCATLCRIVVG